jgi:hypothetical protein
VRDVIAFQCLKKQDGAISVRAASRARKSLFFQYASRAVDGGLKRLHEFLGDADAIQETVRDRTLEIGCASRVFTSRM